MSPSLEADGYAIHRRVFSEEQVARMRSEADLIVGNVGTACVRHVRERSGYFRELSSCKVIRSLLPEQALRPVRSLLFDKTATENWPVAWHQDLTIAVTKQRRARGYGPWSFKGGCPHVQPPIALLKHMVTVRVHLDDVPSSNGALRVIPGSHKDGKIPMASHANYDMRAAISCECSAGDLLLMSPLILHSSRRSATPSRRRVIHLEYARDADLDPQLEWFEHDDDERQIIDPPTG